MIYLPKHRLPGHYRYNSSITWIWRLSNAQIYSSYMNSASIAYIAIKLIQGAAVVPGGILWLIFMQQFPLNQYIDSPVTAATTAEGL